MRIGSLGDVIFEVASGRVFTPQAFSMSREARFEDHVVQGSFARSEFLAPGLATGSLAITLRKELGCEPFEEVERLENMSVQGTVLRLIIAGKNLGRWTIRKVDQSWKYLLGTDEGPMAISLSLELKEYITCKTLSSAKKTQQQGTR